MPDGPYTPPPAPINPFAIAGQIASIRNAVQQNILMQKTMGAQQAIGTALQNATNADGVTDYGSAMSAASQDPNAAFGMQEALANAQTQRMEQYKLGMAHYGAIHQVMGALAEKPGLTQKDFSNAAADLMGMDPSFTGKMVAEQLAQIAGMNPSDDPQKNQQIAAMYRDQAMDAVQQMQAHHQTTMINTGGQTVPVNTAPEAPVPAPLDNTMSPGDANTPVQVFNPQTNAPEWSTKANVAANGGQAGPALGTAAGADVSAAASAKAAADLPNQVEEARQTKATVGLLRGDLANMPATGPSANAIQHLKTLASEFGLPVNEGEVASTAGFKKLSAQLVAKMYQGVPSGSDKTLSNIMAGNPSLDLTTLSNKRLADYIEAGADIKLAEGALWQRNKAMGIPDTRYNDFHQQFYQQFDPRMFMRQYQSPQERQQTLDSMGPQEKTQFLSRMGSAIKNGIIPK